MNRRLIKKKIRISQADRVKQFLSGLNLNTVCSEALCPNISDCHEKNQATFLILGKICTRNCAFCNVRKGAPEPVDYTESVRVAVAVKKLNLKHAVITSPARDDLSDGGAGIFYDAVKAVRKLNPGTTVEVLIPDFKGNYVAIKRVVESKPDIIGHNLETVKRLYNVRNGAEYNRSLEVLRKVKQADDTMKTKSALMLGMGEEEEEVFEAMNDLLESGCRYLSLGQYLSPSKSHYPVQEFLSEERFADYKRAGVKMGFTHIESGTFVRSSYNAERYLTENKNEI